MTMTSSAPEASAAPPGCPGCRQPLRWQRTRRTFTAEGVRGLVLFRCDACGHDVERIEAGDPA
jgi:hypothetical protein